MGQEQVMAYHGGRGGRERRVRGMGEQGVMTRAVPWAAAGRGARGVQAINAAAACAAALPAPATSFILTHIHSLPMPLPLTPPPCMTATTHRLSSRSLVVSWRGSVLMP